MLGSLVAGLVAVAQVNTTGNAAEALATLESPRLSPMDFQLPGMVGFDLTQRLKVDPARRHVVILTLTAYAMSGEETALGARCDGYIAKPMTRRLPGVITDHVARCGAAPLA